MSEVLPDVVSARRFLLRDRDANVMTPSWLTLKSCSSGVSMVLVRPVFSGRTLPDQHVRDGRPRSRCQVPGGDRVGGDLYRRESRPTEGGSRAWSSLPSTYWPDAPPGAHGVEAQVAPADRATSFLNMWSPGSDGRQATPSGSIRRCSEPHSHSDEYLSLNLLADVRSEGLCGVPLPVRG